jgi:hypothetical protein
LLCTAQTGIDARFKHGAPHTGEMCGQLLAATAPPLRVVFKTSGGLRLYLVRCVPGCCDETRVLRRDTNVKPALS